MQLRVISGSARGRKLKSVPGDTTRPIMDRVKEALFNIIANDGIDCSWWDLFAGTGAVGIEALSRGAAFVRFTDIHPGAIETIRWNVDHCGFNLHAEILQGNVLNLLGGNADRQFDYVYIAPPQYQGLWSSTLNKLDGNPGWLAKDAWIIAQIDPVEYTQMSWSHFIEFDQRKYGKTLLLFITKR